MAIQCIYRDLEYATSLIKAKAGKNASRRDTVGVAGVDADDDDEEEESWTFVGGGDVDVDDFDPESAMRRAVSEMESVDRAAIKGKGVGRRSLGSRVLGGGSGSASGSDTAAKKLVSA